MTSFFAFNLIIHTLFAFQADAKIDETLSCPFNNERILKFSQYFEIPKTRKIVFTFSEPKILELFEETKQDTTHFLEEITQKFERNLDWIEKSYPHFYRDFAKTEWQVSRLDKGKNKTTRTCIAAAMKELAQIPESPFLEIEQIASITSLMCRSEKYREKLRTKLSLEIEHFKQRLQKNDLILPFPEDKDDVIQGSEKRKFLRKMEVFWVLFPNLKKTYFDKRKKVIEPFLIKTELGQALSEEEKSASRVALSEIQVGCAVLARETRKMIAQSIIETALGAASLVNLVALTPLLSLSSILVIAGVPSNTLLTLGLISFISGNIFLVADNMLIISNFYQSFALTELVKAYNIEQRLLLRFVRDLIKSIYEIPELSAKEKKALIHALRKSDAVSRIVEEATRADKLHYLKLKRILNVSSLVLSSFNAIEITRGLIQTLALVHSGSSVLSSNAELALNHVFELANKHAIVTYLNAGATTANYLNNATDVSSFARKFSVQSLESITLLLRAALQLTPINLGH